MDNTSILAFALHIAGAATLPFWAVRLLRPWVESGPIPCRFARLLAPL